MWALLHTQVLDTAHVSSNILEALSVMIGEWLKDVVATVTRGFMVTDSGANLVKAIWDGGFVGICWVALLYT